MKAAEKGALPIAPRRVVAKLRPRRRWRLVVGIVLGVLILVAAGVASVPLLLMERTRADAIACLARFERPRGPRLIDCTEGIDKFSRLARYSYTHHDATYRAEELWARIMVAEYENASIGAPDPDVRKQTAKFVDEAQTVLEKGSQRISLDELGPAIASPHLGKLASALGDRQTLVEHYDWWGLWSVRVRALQAALVEGDLDKADEMARRYSEWDPRDADLRTYAGSVMCLGRDPGKGLELLARVPGDRADKRYAAIARNYGEVLAVIEACAKKAGVDAPTPPQVQHAGSADVEYARMVEDIRLSKLPAVTHDLADKAVGWLEDDRGLEGDEPWARAMLLAAVVAHDDRAGDARGPLASGVLANAGKPRSGEGPLAPELPLLPEGVVDEAPGLRPMLSAASLSLASSKLAKLADGATDVATSLRRTAAALGVHAAIAFARAGDGARAVEAADRAAVLAGAPEAAADLTAASLLYVAGDPKQALARAEHARSGDGALRTARTLVAALSHLSLGEHDQALALVAAVPQADLDKADGRLALDVRWLDVALAPSGERHAGPLPIPEWTGMADPSERWRSMGARAIRADFDAWKIAFAAPDDQRLAFRYALIHARGDAPASLIPWLVAGARLAPDGARGASVEVWLDTLSAEDAPRFSLTAYDFFRQQAAQARGDGPSADAWGAKLRTLRALKTSEPDLEIARFLGL